MNTTLQAQKTKTFLKQLSYVLLGALAVGSEALAQSKPTLTLYSSVGYAKDVAEAFTKSTGIPVKLVNLSTGPLLARVQAEKQNPQWT